MFTAYTIGSGGVTAGSSQSLLKTFFFLTALCGCFGLHAQNWRYAKGRKLYTDLAEAIRNKEDVYNLSLFSRRIQKEKLSAIGEMKNIQYLSINNADLDSLPGQIFTLPNIRTLNLCNNGNVVKNRTFLVARLIGNSACQPEGEAGNAGEQPVSNRVDG